MKRDERKDVLIRLKVRSAPNITHIQIVNVELFSANEKNETCEQLNNWHSNIKCRVSLMAPHRTQTSILAQRLEIGARIAVSSRHNCLQLLGAEIRCVRAQQIGNDGRARTGVGQRDVQALDHAPPRRLVNICQKSVKL